jgi:hypothetical protein
MRGAPHGTHRDEVNAKRENQRTCENTHARFFLSVGHAQTHAQTQKTPKDASIKDCLYPINLLQHALGRYGGGGKYAAHRN